MEIFGGYSNDDSSVVDRDLYRSYTDFFGLDKYRSKLIFLAAEKCFLGLKTNGSKVDLEHYFLENEEYVILINAPIDNKDELLLELNIEHTNSPKDVELVYRCFILWGEDCFTRFEGCINVVIWDKRKKKMIVSVDHLGLSPFFYFKNSSLFLFSSSVGNLIELNGIGKNPSPIYIGSVLSGWIPDMGITAYDDIFLSLSSRIYNISDNNFSVERYWAIEETPPLQIEKIEDAFEHFLYLYNNAIKDSLRNSVNVASTLSGGLDSGSVSVLAANQLKRNGKKLTSYTAVPKFDKELFVSDSRFADEHFYARQTADFNGNIDIKLVDGSTINLLEGIKKSVDILHSPSFAAGNFYWFHEIYQDVVANNIDLLLVGQRGNVGVSWKGDNPFQKNKLRKLLSKLGKKVIRKKDQEVCYESLIVSKSLRKEIEKFKKAADHRLESIVKDGISKKRMFMVSPLRIQAIEWKLFASYYGVRTADPTGNKKLMEFCLSVPDHLFRDKNFDRLLIRKGMNGLMPQEVLYNTKKGRQVADILQRVKELKSDFITLINEFSQHSIVKEYVNVEELKRQLNMICNEPYRSEFNVIAVFITRGISVGYFLQTHFKNSTKEI